MRGEVGLCESERRFRIRRTAGRLGEKKLEIPKASKTTLKALTLAARDTVAGKYQPQKGSSEAVSRNVTNAPASYKMSSATKALDREATTGDLPLQETYALESMMRLLVVRERWARLE